MTRRYVEIVSSDLSGVEGAETVQVPAFDIDLTEAERAEMFRLLEPYLRAGRAAPHAAGRAVARTTTSKELTAQRREVREWANGHGYVVGVSGSIKKEVWEAFASKTPAPGWVDPAAARHEDSAAYHAELAGKVKTPVTERPPATVTKIPAARKSQKVMSPAFQAAEAAYADTTITEAVTAQKAAAPRKTAAPRKGTPRAVKAAVVAGGGLKTAAATKAAPRKTATAKVSRTR